MRTQLIILNSKLITNLLINYILFDFTDLIKQKFELFSGKRLEVEDQRLLNAVTPLVEEEVADFVRTTIKNNYLINQSVADKSQSEAVKELEKLLSSVETEWRLKLTSRINKQNKNDATT